MKPIDFDPDTHPKLASGPPRFNGEHVVKWIRKIQKYYNHSFMPLQERLYLTSFLFDDAAEEWLTYWEDNTDSKNWDDFLLSVKKCFDPDLYEDYVGRLAMLRQTSTIDAYQTSFESMLQKVKHVGDATVTSLFIAGLKPPLKQELLTSRPATLQDAFALAQQVAACQAAAAPVPHNSTRPNWSPRSTPTTSQNQHREGQPPNRQGRESAPSDYPIVRVSAVERTERTRKGQCWYCPEPWSRTHVCSKKFYTLMGSTDDSDEEEEAEERAMDDDRENMVITGDVSSIHVICPKIKPRSIRMRGRINGSSVSILIDGGNTHNFIKPAVAEQLSLPLHSITPFRVFVGNGASLKCTFACLLTPINMQGHQFAIDLFILPVEGPDVILGVQWLQELGDVTKNYRHLTMRLIGMTSPSFSAKNDPHPVKSLTTTCSLSEPGDHRPACRF